MKQSREVTIVKDKALADKVEGFLPAIVVISALTGFSVLAWYAYHTNTQTSPDGDLLVVEADKTPIKEKPLDPGGMKFPNQDKTVFETFANGSQPAKVERVLPSPEEPLPRGSDTSGTQTWVNERLHKNVGELEAVDKAVAAESGKREQVIGDDTKKVEAIPQNVVALKPDKISSEVVESEKEKAQEIVSFHAPEPTKEPEVKAEKNSVIKGATWEDAAKDIKDEDAAPVAPVELKPAVSKHDEVYAAKPAPALKKDLPKPQPAPAAAPAAAPASGGAKVQLGAYKSDAEARTDLAKIKKKFPAAGGYTPVVVKAELEKGTFYRLRLTGFGSSADAKAFCAKLSSGGQGCLLPKD